MSRYDDQVLDEFQRPVPGVSVYVYDAAGNLDTLTDDLAAPLANPLTTDADGMFYFNAADGEKLLDFRFGGRTRYKEAILVGPIPTGPQGIQGDVAKVVTRAELGAVVAPPANTTRYLVEAGRVGMFQFSTANLAASVTADPQQGVYVPPAASPTGAAGAWVRQFDETVNVRWFGATPGAAAAVNGAAFEAAIAYLKSIAGNVSTNGFYKSSTSLLVPAGTYDLDRTLDISHTFEMRGEWRGGQQGNAPTTCLKWPVGVDGIRVQRYNTSAEATLDGATHFAGDGFSLRGIRLQGGYAGVEAEIHGFHAKGIFNITDCMIDTWQGAGLFSNSDTGGGGASMGNSSNSHITNLFISGCRDGIERTGGDANAWVVIGLDVTGNRRWGKNFTDFLGGTELGGHAADNGLVAGIPTIVSHGGNRYAVRYGQDVGASTNAPSGTTADNTWWYYMSAGGVNAGLNIPAWSNAMSIRAGGVACYQNVNAQNVVNGSYTEGGQGPIQFVAPTLVIGGTQGAGLRGSGGYQSAYAMNASEGAIRCDFFAAYSLATGTGNLLGKDRLEFNRTTDQFSWEWFNNDLALTALRSSAPSVWALRLTGELTTANIGKRKIDFPNGFGLGDKKVLPGTAAPVAGTYVQGDMVLNSAPAAAGPMGWMCVVGGTPGTWKAMANLAA